MHDSTTPQSATPSKIDLREGEVLVLRTCKPDGKSRCDFQWPMSGEVSCPDWLPTSKCGNGLHGLLRGVGDAGYLDPFPGREVGYVAMLVVVHESDIVDLGEKVKFSRGRVVFAGTIHDAAAILKAHYPASPIVFGTATAGDSGTATAGDRGTATAGYSGTATAGYRGTATAGDSGTATAGDRGTATAGYRGTATAGDSGTATAGDRGTATAGYRGTATAGDSGTATAGKEGALVVEWYDQKHGCYRRAVGHVDGEKLLPGTPYRVTDVGEFVAVKESGARSE